MMFKNKAISRIVLLVFATALIACGEIPDAKKSPAETFKVIAISDGDTFSVLKDKTTYRIRVDAIDAPERGMPYYKVSKKYLSDLCFGKNVLLQNVTTDRYGRWVARAKLPNGKDLSSEMIRAGLAWHYKKYSSDKVLAALEISARKNKLGLWRDKSPIAPWEVRRLHRSGFSTKERFEERVQ